MLPFSLLELQRFHCSREASAGARVHSLATQETCDRVLGHAGCTPELSAREPLGSHDQAGVRHTRVGGLTRLIFNGAAAFGDTDVFPLLCFTLDFLADIAQRPHSPD